MQVGVVHKSAKGFLSCRPAFVWGQTHSHWNAGSAAQAQGRLSLPSAISAISYHFVLRTHSDNSFMYRSI